jgi:predicted dehydrogenase
MRVGLVGCGHIGTVHAFALQQLSEAKLVDATLTLTYDDDPKRAERVARHHGGEPALSLGDLIAGVDVVWVCTWTAGHLEPVRAASERGLPIFCEKPLAPNLEAATEVADALARVPHQVGLVLRDAPVFANLASRVQSGDYGAVLGAAMRDDQYFPIQGLYASTWRKDVALAGGGTLIEHSIHDIDVLRWLLGGPVSVSARTATRFGHPGIEDTAAVTLTLADGALAQLLSVWHQVLTRESGRHLEIFCERAAFWTDDDYLGPMFMQTEEGITSIEGAVPDWAQHLTVPEIYAKAIAQYAAPTKAFLDALCASGPATIGHPSAADALAAHRLVDAAYRSAAAGGVVTYC